MLPRWIGWKTSTLVTAAPGNFYNNTEPTSKVFITIYFVCLFCLFILFVYFCLFVYAFYCIIIVSLLYRYLFLHLFIYFFFIFFFLHFVLMLIYFVVFFSFSKKVITIL